MNVTAGFHSTVVLLYVKVTTCTIVTAYICTCTHSGHDLDDLPHIHVMPVVCTVYAVHTGNAENSQDGKVSSISIYMYLSIYNGDAIG